MTTDQLPPLPEPVVHRCEWDTSSGGVWSQYHDNESDPLPDKWDDEQPDVIQGFYSGDQLRERDAMWADQVRAAVLAERERIAAMLDRDWLCDTVEEREHRAECAASIRKGE